MVEIDFANKHFEATGNVLNLVQDVLACMNIIYCELKKEEEKDFFVMCIKQALREDDDDYIFREKKYEEIAKS